MNVTRSLLEMLRRNNKNGMDVFREWKRGDYQKKVMQWSPPRRRKRGRPKATWAEGIRGLLGEKGLMEEGWNDRDKWKKKIRQLSNGRRKM
jgi:hypothetical protein